MSFSRVTLEVSLKPFKKTDDEYIRSVARQIFTQWHALLKGRQTVSLMLWTADGSEILEYNGDPDAPFEWAYFIGTANLPLFDPEADDPHTSNHAKKHYYMKNPPVMTYRILKNIVRILKEEGKRAFPDAQILVGETFDIGPEFAISPFKYERHREILIGSSHVDSFGFVDSTAALHAEARAYAAYPDGIPEGLPFATFFGAQSEIFLRDMGFDYLWLSNGLGFSADPWIKTGKIYDGKRFYPEKLPETRRKVFDFWRLFREACPSFPLEVRGTNNTVGIDYATDGVPLHDIYRGNFGILPPPNSPWAALNDNFGLEILGHLTRNAELPGDRFLFRYYLHDPWWLNSPWYDRYDGAAGDVYLPMSLSRIDETGRAASAGLLYLLSIDNSFGDMPDACVNEPLPHLLKAEKDAPDEPAPVVLIYPVRAYTTASDEETLREMYEGDSFVVDEINDGFPLASVADADLFLKHDLSVYRKSVLLSPVPTDGAWSEKLRVFASRGGGVILYGTRERLAAFGSIPGVRTVPTDSERGSLREALASFGYGVRFEKADPSLKVPTLTVSRSDNATWFSAYSNDTTSDTVLRFPLGAPVLLGTSAVIRDGWAHYRFGRCEHRECRVFIEQKEDGVVSAREGTPASLYYHRRIFISGLKDATVHFFPESECRDKGLLVTGTTLHYGISSSSVTENTPKLRFVRDEKNGDHLVAEHVSGNVSLFFLRVPEILSETGKPASPKDGSV